MRTMWPLLALALLLPTLGCAEAKPAQVPSILPTTTEPSARAPAPPPPSPELREALDQLRASKASYEAARARSETPCKEPEDDPNLEVASQAMLDSSEVCLITVRDQRTKYAATAACTALAALVRRYLEAEPSGHGVNAPTPLKYQLRFAQAQRMAWTALALSEANHRILRIW